MLALLWLENRNKDEASMMPGPTSCFVVPYRRRLPSRGNMCLCPSPAWTNAVLNFDNEPLSWMAKGDSWDHGLEASAQAGHDVEKRVVERVRKHVG